MKISNTDWMQSKQMQAALLKMGGTGSCPDQARLQYARFNRPMHWLLVCGLFLTAGCARTDGAQSGTRTEVGTETGVVRQETTTRTAATREADEKATAQAFENMKAESKEAWDATTTYLTREKDRLGAEMKETSDKLERRIAELRAKQESGTLKAEERQRTDQELIDLEAARTNLNKMKNQAGAASQDAWGKIKTNWHTLQNEVEARLNSDGKADTKR